MTTAATPPAPVPLRIERQGLYLLDEDELVRALGPVQTREVRPVQEQQATYGVEWQRAPLTLWGDGNARPNYGLAPLLMERGRRAGREVRIISANQEFCRLAVPEGLAARNRRMLSWICDSELGIVEHGKHVIVADLIREIIQCFQGQARIAVIFGSQRQLQRATSPSSPGWIESTLLRARFEYEQPPRVAVGTFRDIARDDVGLHDYDLVLVPRATDVQGQYAQRALGDPALHCRLIGFMSEDERMSPATRGRVVAAFGGRRCSVPQFGRVERDVNLALLHLPNYEVETIEDEVRFLRQAVWRNDRFNDFVASAATAIANGSAHGLWPRRRMPSQIADIQQDTSIVIGCDNVEHALELARRLRGWQVNLGIDCYLDGLSPRGLAALRRQGVGNSWSLEGCRTRILTADAFRTFDVSGVGIVIWAGTGAGLPPIERQELLVDAGNPATSRPLLVVDVVNQTPKLAWKCRERRWHYADRGWHFEETDEATFRMTEFEAENTDANWQERSLAQSARRRHWLGELLPRRVLSGRFYLPFGGRRTSPLPGGATLRPLTEVIDHEHLLDTYEEMRKKNGPGAGVDGLSYRDLSWGEISSLMREASRAIRERRYCPHPSRLVRIPKGEDDFRDLRIMTVVDRVVAKALADALQPVIDPRFLSCSYGFRPGRSKEQMLAQVLHDITADGRHVVAVDDVADAFPTIPIRPLLNLLQTVMADVQSHQPQTEISDWFPLLETMIRGAYPLSREKDVEQGNPLSPMLANVFFHAVLDQPICADRGGTPWFRYADNLCCVGHDTAECRQLLARASSLLIPYGMTLKGEWQPINLLGAGARVRDFLGFALSMTDGVPRLSILDSSYTDLTDGLVDCYETSYPERTAILVTNGWLQSQGPALELQEERCLEMVYRAASYAGFRELGRSADLLSAIQESRTRWLAVRSQVTRAGRQSHR